MCCSGIVAVKSPRFGGPVWWVLLFQLANRFGLDQKLAIGVLQAINAAPL